VGVDVVSQDLRQTGLYQAALDPSRDVALHTDRIARHLVVFPLPAFPTAERSIARKPLTLREIRFGAGSRRLRPAARDAALHKTQCCHAPMRLPKRIPRAYLRIVNKDGKKRTKDETRPAMNLIRNYRNWRRYRETVSELSRLSNRELSDLGIARGDINFVARKSI
jgi:uncharacterized protein YjiS (DUF1127 family)